MAGITVKDIAKMLSVETVAQVLALHVNNAGEAIELTNEVMDLMVYTYDELVKIADVYEVEKGLVMLVAFAPAARDIIEQAGQAYGGHVTKGGVLM